MIVINKKTDQSIIVKVYDSYWDKNPIDLSKYVDFISAITDDGRVLIEKKMSLNGIQLLKDENLNISYILKININNNDTKNLTINPPDEERIRLFELFGIDNCGKIDKIYEDSFYIKGTGYYVHWNRSAKHILYWG